jgi:chromosome segregation ATPase
VFAGRNRVFAALAVLIAMPVEVHAAAPAEGAAAPYPGGRPCNRNAAAAEIKGLTAQLSAVTVQIKSVEIQRTNDRDQIPGLNAGLPETRDRLEITQRRIGLETGQIASLERSANELRNTIARREAEAAACADKDGQGAAPR